MEKPDDLDIIGQLCYDRDQDNDMDDIIVHSDICEPDLLPRSILFRSDNYLFEAEEKAIPLCKGRVLDVGAGTGCLSQILIDKGLHVESIDTSQGAVDYMNKNGLIASKQDFFEMKEDEFDTIFLMMNGIGIVGLLSNLPNFFAQCKKLLAPNGKVLLDSSDIAYMFENEDGSISINLNQNYYGEVKYQMQYKENFGPWFDWLYVDFETLSNLASQYGFQATKVFEDNNHHYLAELKLI